MPGKVQQVIRVAIDDELIEDMKDAGAVSLSLNSENTRVVQLEYLESTDSSLGPVEDPSAY